MVSHGQGLLEQPATDNWSNQLGIKMSQCCGMVAKLKNTLCIFIFGLQGKNGNSRQAIIWQLGRGDCILQILCRATIDIYGQSGDNYQNRIRIWTDILALCMALSICHSGSILQCPLARSRVEWSPSNHISDVCPIGVLADLESAIQAYRSGRANTGWCFYRRKKSMDLSCNDNEIHNNSTE